jgi:nitric oxide reductase activation protein
VDYRGEFRPDLASLLLVMSATENGKAPADLISPLTQHQLKELLEHAARWQAPETDTEGLELIEPTDQILDSLRKELNRRALENAAYRPDAGMPADDVHGSLEENGQDTFVYDEWDLSTGTYKSRWCCVRERYSDSGGISFYHQTLRNHSFLVQKIRREFEQGIPESHRKEKRLIDGEEYDLDALVEAVIDVRSGATPSEKLYWRRNKTERDVAVALLLDMSGSTAEGIGKPPDQRNRIEPALAEFQRSPAYEARSARIIDIEKEGVVLLVDVLESLGDRYGIYGFSGNGRENVDFYIIKELEERFSSEVPRRIDSIKPQHATRMGPAIRHAIRKLNACDARSKFLFLISDGRPQDRGYARARDDRDYAVYDTRMALIEARAAAITPFCLTVDSQGNDYLATMMDGLSYEVLADVSMLPLRLTQLYKQLTRYEI